MIGLASCYEAFAVAPTATAMIAADHDVRVAWFGSAAELSEAKRLGLPPLELRAAPANERKLPALTRAAAFAAEVLGDADVAVTIGPSPFALALAQVAREGGRPVLRLNAGIRGGHRHTNFLLADHAASLRCVPTRQARHTLLREGAHTDSVHTVGSLLGEAVALALPNARANRSSSHLWLAIEHADTPRGAAGIKDLIELTEQAAARANLRVLAAPTVLRQALRDAGIDRNDDWFSADDAAAQLLAAREAAIIVTDSVGYQELAASLGIRCVALMTLAGRRNDLAQLGHIHESASCSQTGRIIDQALAAPQPSPLPSDGAAAKVCAALDAHLRHEPSTPIDRDLPTDTDASGRTFDDEETANVTQVLRAGTLNSTRGTFVHRFEREFADWLGVEHAIACTSGSAAVHCAIAALQLTAGDEVITTPITDMGALTPILYEGAVPVFADVDPTTLNVTAETIAAQLTDRTRAIVVTHLFGQPCELDAIVALAERHQLTVIEDAAQAFGATWNNRKVGTFGRLAAFSLQQGKHITTGEGGIVCTDDDELARRLFLFVNKAWGYGDPQPDHYFPALNYRMTELQGGVACGQLPKLDQVVANRRNIASALHDELLRHHGGPLAGLRLPSDPERGTHAYWKFPLLVDGSTVDGGAVALGQRLRQQGIACAPRYVQKPAFECQLFRDWHKSPVMSLPLSQNPRGATTGPLFDRANYPGAVRGLDDVIVLPINERYEVGHVVAISNAILAAHGELAGSS